MHNTENTRVQSLNALVSPALIHDETPITAKAAELVTQTRQEISNILHGKDQRLVVVVGPCSIHDPAAAIDYAQRLKNLTNEFKQKLCLVMRVYFEKPRTTVGWKGLINDPDLDGSFKINHGLRLARKLLLDINEMGVPTGSEFLDTTIPQYISDLTSWAAIGARTTESQIHRELASGLSMPVGFKNGTTGNIKIAVDAVYAATQPHHFLGISPQGLASIVTTTGNSDSHIILRGSDQEPNYDASHVYEAACLLAAQKLPQQVMVDCSHGNSRKDYLNQLSVIEDISRQLKHGEKNIFGVMIESNLVAGKQALKNKENLVYGQSITDGCIDWDDTITALKILAEAA